MLTFQVSPLSIHSIIDLFKYSFNAIFSILNKHAFTFSDLILLSQRKKKQLSTI